MEGLVPRKDPNICNKQGWYLMNKIQNEGNRNIFDVYDNNFSSQAQEDTFSDSSSDSPASPEQDPQKVVLNRQPVRIKLQTAGNPEIGHLDPTKVLPKRQAQPFDLIGDIVSDFL